MVPLVKHQAERTYLGCSDKDLLLCLFHPILFQPLLAPQKCGYIHHYCWGRAHLSWHQSHRFMPTGTGNLLLSDLLVSWSHSIQEMDKVVLKSYTSMPNSCNSFFACQFGLPNHKLKLHVLRTAGSPIERSQAWQTNICEIILTRYLLEQFWHEVNGAIHKAAATIQHSRNSISDPYTVRYRRLHNQQTCYTLATVPIAE